MINSIYSSLPSSIAKKVKLLPDILKRRESVEIVAESALHGNEFE